MNTRSDQYSDGFERNSSAPSEGPFDGASSDDISRYSRYTADSRYVRERAKGNGRPAHAATPVGDEPVDDAGRDFTPSHGVLSKSEASTLIDDKSPARHTAVGPRAQRLAAKRQAAEREAALDIPTASELPRGQSRASDGVLDESASEGGARLPQTLTDADARPYSSSPSYDAQQPTSNPRMQAQSNYQSTPSYAPMLSSYARDYNDRSTYDDPMASAGVENTSYARPENYVNQSRKTKRRRRRVVAIVAACVFALVVCGAGFAFAFINNINSNLQQNVDDEVLEVLETESAGEPFYMLLMGTDSSSERRESAEFAGDNFRTDSMMLLRIDPQNKKVACISLMRDTKMDYGENGIAKLNEAHEIGGTDLTIKTVSKLAGVPISHYAIIDFDGFKDVVDMLGGIEVDVQMEINDELAGGHIDAGLQTLNGEQALILSRSRHNYDELGDGDAYRAANQRLVISSIAKKVLNSDVSTMIATIEKLSQSVETDFGVMDIVNLGSNMRGMNMDTDFYTATMPTTSEYSNMTWWEILDKPAWKKMMSRVDQGLPPLEDDVIDPFTGIVIANSGSANSIDGSDSSAGEGSATSGGHTGTVAVRNGCGASGVAAQAAEIIDEMGFTTDVADASSSEFKLTVIAYNDPDQRDEAQQIANALGIGNISLNDNELYIFDTDFLVVVGQDWVTEKGSSR